MTTRKSKIAEAASRLRSYEHAGLIWKEQYNNFRTQLYGGIITIAVEWSNSQYLAKVQGLRVGITTKFTEWRKAADFALAYVTARLLSRRQQILMALATGVSDEDLEQVASKFPHLISEAAREARGEVTYKMVQHPAAAETITIQQLIFDAIQLGLEGEKADFVMDKEEDPDCCHIAFEDGVMVFVKLSVVQPKTTFES